ncbi:MAG: cob(I)yrinic acid a,c-diamide adenosyltransferase [Patescibacteria group bacterium]|nr:cob(I)yrinic acid a,c-diamide adenosyltransferase [Patescibacteria group bacterium]
MIIVFTGNGKGKTTASLGHMMRAAGQGKRTLMLQFIKGPWISGEHKFLDAHPALQKNIRVVRGGKGFVKILGDKLPFATHKKAAQKTLERAKQAVRSRAYDLLVLDEVNVAVSLKLVTATQVLAVAKQMPPEKIIILSGRYAPKSFIRAADLVTEMKEIKHPFHKGKKAQVGFEF